MPGSVPRAGTCTARTPSLEIARATRSALFGRRVDVLDDEQRRVRARAARRRPPRRPRAGGARAGCSAAARRASRRRARGSRRSRATRPRRTSCRRRRASRRRSPSRPRRSRLRVAASWVPAAPPVVHHPGLRERERGEDADHVEVDEVVRVRAVDPQQEAARLRRARRIPFENTSRSPRFVNCCGAKRSRASSAERRGKPWNDVFAARISTSSVRPWTT